MKRYCQQDFQVEVKYDVDFLRLQILIYNNRNNIHYIRPLRKFAAAFPKFIIAIDMIASSFRNNSALLALCEGNPKEIPLAKSSDAQL